MTTGIPVDVELSGPLAGVAIESDELGSGVASRLDEEISDFGIPGSAAVTVAPGKARRVLQVRVNGRVQPYPLGLLARSWQCVAPSDMQGVPYQQAEGDRAAADDRWLAGLGGALSTRHGSLGADFVAEAVAQVVMRRPQAFFGEAQLEAYRPRPGQLEGWSAETDRTLRQVAHFLLGLGVSLGRDDVLTASVHTLHQAGLAEQDIAEAVFERLRARTIEIHCQPGYIVAIAGGDPVQDAVSVYDVEFRPGARAAFERMERQLFEELGLRTPEIVWAPDPGLSGSSVAIKFNDRFSPVLRAPSPDKRVVDATVDVLRDHADDIEAEPFFDAVWRRQLALVPEDVADRLADSGLKLATPVQWIADAVRLELRARANDVIGMEDVEYHMARLHEREPDLVGAVLGRLPIGDITRILRALVREGRSIKDLLTIFERLRLYEEVEVDEPSELVFDSRFPVTPDMAGRPSWVRRFEFVRAGVLPAEIKWRGRALDALDVIRIDPRLESRAASVAYAPPGGLRSWLDDEEQAAFCDAIRVVIEDGVASNAAPMVLTTRWARGGIREVLSTEFPHLAVLSHEDLLAGASLTPLARVSIA